MVWVAWLRRAMGRQWHCRFENFRIGPSLSNRNSRFEFDKYLDASHGP